MPISDLPPAETLTQYVPGVLRLQTMSLLVSMAVTSPSDEYISRLQMTWLQTSSELAPAARYLWGYPLTGIPPR
jgi:hypothetical protein